jgi:hypothetical protein
MVSVHFLGAQGFATDSPVDTDSAGLTPYRNTAWQSLPLARIWYRLSQLGSVDVGKHEKLRGVNDFQTLLVFVVMQKWWLDSFLEPGELFE